MNANTILPLNEDQLATWVSASKYFSREEINRLITQAGLVQNHIQNTDAAYEICRTDIPEAFDSLLKLQNSGAATRHVEILQSEFREVLRVNTSLLDAITTILSTLIEIILRLLSKDSANTDYSPKTTLNAGAPNVSKGNYVPTWKRQEKLIGYDGPYL